MLLDQMCAISMMGEVYCKASVVIGKAAWFTLRPAKIGIRNSKVPSS
jgi:hypothetical protein